MNNIIEQFNNITDLDNAQELFAALLAMPDEEFEAVSPQILDDYNRSLNNPSDRIALAQALNAGDVKADELAEAFAQVEEAIASMDDLSITKKDFITQMLGGFLNCVNETEGISKRIVNVPIEFCHSDAKIPTYAHVTDSGADIYAVEDITINPGQTILIPTGIKVALPHGYELQVRPKSGRSLKSKLRVANTPGTIDAGYRDEIGIIIDNIDPYIKDLVINPDGTINMDGTLFGSSYTISKGEKIAQLVLMEVPKANFYKVDSVSKIGDDRNGGFGSTGLK